MEVTEIVMMASSDLNMGNPAPSSSYLKDPAGAPFGAVSPLTPLIPTCHSHSIFLNKTL